MKVITETKHAKFRKLDGFNIIYIKESSIHSKFIESCKKYCCSSQSDDVPVLQGKYSLMPQNKTFTINNYEKKLKLIAIKTLKIFQQHLKDRKENLEVIPDGSIIFLADIRVSNWMFFIVVVK